MACCHLPGKGIKAFPKQVADMEQELHVELAPTQPQISLGRGKTALGWAKTQHRVLVML